MEGDNSTPRRRSQRHTATTYDSNGRDHLASLLGWPRDKLERWLSSDTVQPHMLLWYQVCFKSSRRFNDATDWINAGETGYFYNPSGLEEDLLLMCLGEGHVEDAKLASDDSMARYADETADTHSWTTQELWARAAWRIVQGNRDVSQLFEQKSIEHPAFTYGFAIDLLCIAFHSMAFRKANSIWEHIIVAGGTKLEKNNPGPNKRMVKQMELDQKQDEADDTLADGEDTDQTSIATTEKSTIMDSDSEFEDPSMPQTPATSPGLKSPKTPPRKDSKRPPALADTQIIQKWVTDMTSSPDAAGQDTDMLNIVDGETGEPITGYRRAR